ncbi:type III secretion system chaperone [Diaphorobacter caeni]|uniref:type III secretion system chaperone n=1 Tax=Diaphorobacter caeni TaxID=2784387 RepID=UPI00188E6DD8|nr:type III secretion system chaperone [Diaphorobacter caeni]MBF5006322.1 type III secretion system chaperone [Diaphorobacter caeni]
MTISVEVIGALLCDVAPALDLEAVVHHGPAAEWDLVFPDERLVEVVWQADTGLLVLETALGIPQDSDAAALHTLLLQYNQLWRDTGGLRMALNGVDGGVQLGFCLSAAAADVNLLVNVVGNFHAAANAWSERLRQAVVPAADGMMASFLRV